MKVFAAFRFRNDRLWFVGQLASLIGTWMQATAQGYLVFELTGTISSWHIVVMAFALGIANAFDAPARQSIVIDFVDREHLTNAIALNSSMFNAARAVGPAIAGITYSQLGAAWCFFFLSSDYCAYNDSNSETKRKVCSSFCLYGY